MTRKREIGPAGTASRITVGAAAIAVPIAAGVVGWWEIAAALIGFPVIATAASQLVPVASQRWAPEASAHRHGVCSAPACGLTALLVGAAVAVDALTPIDGGVALVVWLGASMLLAALRGYSGCELLAFPNALTGRRDQIGCILFTPIDSAEARRQRGDQPVSVHR